ncbi:FAD-dependent oxidoreductase [Arthrobacter sp. OVS8]|nr:FAD-dependent oxidoreductase [Arthrobacter sp. OVS8]
MAEIDGRTIRFRQALIATGGEPVSPDIPGLDPAVTVTSDTIWELEARPGRLAVVGGGPTACELGQAFARLGTEVTMIVRSRILPKEDPDAADLVRASLEADGVRVLEYSPVENAAVTDSGTLILLRDGTAVDTDTVLLATGRAPRTAGLGLERVGVSLDADGQVITDTRMMTSNPLIRAAGDVTANPGSPTSPAFTHPWPPRTRCSD